MRASSKLILGLVAAIGLAGCVASDIERAGIGAAAGGVAAAALDGSVGTGIVLGGLAGALCDDAGVCR